MLRELERHLVNYVHVCVCITDEESEKNNAEWRAVAKKELQDWYKHHDEQLDKKRRLNRYEHCCILMSITADTVKKSILTDSIELVAIILCL